ncbi:hypothetical protein SNEBB_006309 [Seison nebaliae]|nr:hypothetical protein SNEBB_006309 [Seison nebaliae]
MNEERLPNNMKHDSGTEIDNENGNQVNVDGYELLVQSDSDGSSINGDNGADSCRSTVSSSENENEEIEQNQTMHKVSYMINFVDEDQVKKNQKDEKMNINLRKDNNKESIKMIEKKLDNVVECFSYVSEVDRQKLLQQDTSKYSKKYADAIADKEFQLIAQRPSPPIKNSSSDNQIDVCEQSQKEKDTIPLSEEKCDLIKSIMTKFEKEIQNNITIDKSNRLKNLDRSFQKIMNRKNLFPQ